MISRPSSLLVPEPLAHEFLAVFSRLEFTLKSVGLRRERHGSVDAERDAFAQAIHSSFRSLQEAALVEAVKFLTSAPPRKQVQLNGVLSWRDVQRPPGLSDTDT